MAANDRRRKKRAALSRPALVLGGLALVLAVLIVVFFSDGTEEKVKRFIDANVPKPAEAGGGAGPAAASRTVTLFFLADADDLLHKEARDIAAGPTAADEAERALAELVKGSERGLVSPLPAQTKVRQVFIGADGLATVDLSREFAEGFAYGSTAELAAVYAVVDTLVFNFAPVKRVVILVEGAEKETLGGHVDLTRAFLPDYSLVAR
ncbi:MAG TPA: GerMN domain-containing protein [Candidatus Aminicenantes bacterium]|nr:GerMN domain-containing protein [Candidatus Aminicenantes bacterium]